MLLRPDATYLDKTTKRVERIFPRGGDWLKFESELPGAEVFANSVLDPAIGIAGEIGVQAFAAADWRNWTKALQVGLFEISTRVGIPPLEDQSLNQGLATVYSTLHSTVDVLKSREDPGEIAAEIAKNVGLQVLNLVLQSNVVTYVVGQVIQIATWAINVAQAATEHSLAKNISFPPLQTEDPTTDTWQVNRILEVFRSLGTGGVVYPDGKVETGSNADYTKLFLPAYRPSRDWHIQLREQGVAAQQGTAESTNAEGHHGNSYRFDAGDASTFGFMPGAGVMLRVLQASSRMYKTTKGTPMDRYSLRCKGVDKNCWKSQKTFKGDRDCRLCVDAESVWPVEGVGWAYGGAPLNATTPGENVGAFYPTTNKLLDNVLDAIAQPGPLLYSVDVNRINDEWKSTFENFWEFISREWSRYNGYGWRGLLSRLATTMTAFGPSDQLRIGGRDPQMPLDLIANPRSDSFELSFENSIYKQIIEPFCSDLYNLQGYYLDTKELAKIPPGAGAIYSPTGKVRNSELGKYFLTARANLLAANKRMELDLRQVSDPEYRDALRDSGVKLSPVNSALVGSPGIGGGGGLLKPDLKPRRAPRRPRRSRISPFEATVALLEKAGRPARATIPPPARAPTPRSGLTKKLIVGGTVAAGAALTTATLVHLSRLDKDGTAKGDG